MPALALDQRLLDGEEMHLSAGPPDQESVLKSLKRSRDHTFFKTGGCCQVFDRNAAGFRNPMIYGPIQIFLTHTYSFFRIDRYSYSCAACTVPALLAVIRADLQKVRGDRINVENRAMGTYAELADLADALFEASGDDDELLAERLDTLDEETRGALISSDFLNAYQVFYYFFRETPDELVMERLQLHAASDLARGIVVDEVDIYDLIFSLDDGEPVLLLTDGETALARYRGPEAYAAMVRHLDESL